jgi:hypothetical protein
MLIFDYARATLVVGGLMVVPFLSCSSQAPPAMEIMPDSGSDTNAGSSNYTLKPLGCGSAGTQSVVAVSGSTVAFASLAGTSQTQTCTVSMPKPLTSKVEVYNVCYASGQYGGTYTSQVVTSQPYLGPEGVGLAFNSSGTPTIAFTGVGATPPMETCGSNDVFVTSLQGDTFSTPFQVSNGSQSNALIASQAGNCAENVCDEGDTTGFWPAIGFDPSGNTFIPFRDIHFGFAADDFAKSDVELAEGSGTNYQILTIDVSRGGGDYNRIAFDSAGLPAVLQYNSNLTGAAPGVYLNHQVKPGGFGAQEAAGVWVATQLYDGQIGGDQNQGQLGFGISPKGVYGVAYFNNQMGLLVYQDSMDGGNTWSAAVPVDTNGYTGLYPSLAFDDDGNPAVAYYRCNATGPSESTCDESNDGLYLARQSGTAWTPTAIAANPNLFEGMYPALAFVKGKAVIAFQENAYDPVSKTSSITWWVAEEP